MRPPPDISTRIAPIPDSALGPPDLVQAIAARRGGTLLNLALCRAKQGKNATALRLLVEARDVATRDGRDDRVAIATERLEAVRARLSWLTLKPAAGTETPGIAILRDDESIPRELWGTLQAVDPGEHTIVAAAPGYARFEAKVSIGVEGDHQIMEIPPLAPERPAAAAAAAAAPAGGAPATGTAAPAVRTATPVTTTRPVAPAPSTRPFGWAALGLGVSALAAGSVLGVKAIIDSEESKKMCPGNTCPIDAYTKNEDARTEAIFADVAIPVGAASVGVGLYLLLRSSTPAPAALPRVVPAVGPSAASLTLRGVW